MDSVKVLVMAVVSCGNFQRKLLMKSQAGNIIVFLMKSLLALAPSRKTKRSWNCEAPLFQVTICPDIIISSANRIMGGGQNSSLLEIVL